MMRRVLLLGAGGHAKVLFEMLCDSGATIVAVTDVDSARWGQKLMDKEIAGDDDIVLKHAAADIELVNGIASIDHRTLLRRRALYDRFTQLGYRFARVQHSAAAISSHASLDDGVQVMAGAVVQTSVRIGVNAIVNTHACIDHDCVIGPHTHIAPGAILLGNVVIGEEVHIGAGAVLRQGTRIGNRAVVGAGSVVLQDVPAGATVFGMPAAIRSS